ncbi:MAG: hypothetical protein C0629_16890 [Chromatiales bacterium]|nr:MAG: hypothetical protein C0629_16890 [Chromatiales bacterium]
MLESSVREGWRMRAVVIGAGLIGLTTALFLRRHGAEVVVVDRADGPGAETSFANGGLLTPSMADPWNAPGILGKMLRWIGHESAPVLLRPHALPALGAWGIAFLRQSRPQRFRENLLRNVRLANYSLSVMAGLRDEYEFAYDGACSGSLKLLRDTVALEQATAMAESLVSHGVRFQSLDRAATVALEPALAPVADEVAGSLFFPDDESGDAHRFCCAVAEVLRRLGVTLRFGLEVESLRKQGGRMTGVVTAQGVLEADVYVVAAGSYSTQLLRPLGLRLPVRPAKGYSITLPVEGLQQRPRLPVVDDALHAVVVPLGHRLRVAGTAEFAGFDRTLRPQRIDNLRYLLRQTYPEIAASLDAAPVQAWTGLRPMSADGVPLIGVTSIGSLFLNTGHGPLGWTLAAGSAKALADKIMGQPPGFDIGEYSPARFAHFRI